MTIDFTALDFETANEGRDSACAIGLVVVENGSIVERKEMLIRPPSSYFHPLNVSIHGIRWREVRDQPTFEERWSAIAAYVGGRTVVSHNAAFDMSVLRSALDRYGISYPHLGYGCTLVMARRLWPRLESHRLDAVARRLGIEFKHHDALEDARACALIALRAFDETGAENFDELAGKLNMLNGRLFPGGYEPAGKKPGGARRRAR